MRRLDVSGWNGVNGVMVVALPTWGIYGGFPEIWDPHLLAGLFHGKSQSKIRMIPKGYPHDSGNLREDDDQAQNVGTTL